MPDKNNFEPSAKKPKVEIDLNNLVKQEKDSDDSSPGSLEQGQRVQEQLLPTVQLFGTDIPYRRCGKILLFSTAAVVALIRAWLPIAADLQQIINSLQTQNRGEPLKSSLISWGSLKLLLKGSLYDLALGNILSHYRPFGKSPRFDGENELCTLNGVLKIGNQGIQFYVQYGKVFLSCEDVMRVCRERGEEVNTIKPGRNNSNLYKVNGVVDGEMRMRLEDIEQQVKDTKLGSVLRHLLKQVEGVKEKREQMEKEMEQTVSMINRQRITEQACTYDSTDNESKSTLETVHVADSSYVPKRTYKECNNIQCGRTYHFILSCCTREHTLNLMDQRIPFMYHQGKIYLEKCAAFEAIGKTNIIRCSNYRRVDKILIEHGLSPAAEFLQQDIGKKSRRRSGAAGRNRRNHVSLDALTLLVQVNFVMPGRQDVLLAGLEQFSSNPPPPCAHINQGEVENEMDELVNDLDEEEEEAKDENITKDEQSSSGVESEESGLVETPVGSPESVHKVVDLKPVPKSKQQIKTVAIQNMQVPFKVANGQVFLKKHFVFSLLHIKDALRKSSERLEKLLVQIEFPLEKAFLYEGRIANYISTHAVKCILGSVPDISTELGRVELDDLLVELETIEGNIDNLTTIKHLQLKTMGTIRFQVQAGVVYFDTLKLMKLAEIHPSLVRNSPSKANSFVKKLLQDRGINVVSCFLKQRNSKYAFINLRSSLILLQYSHETEQKEKAHRLKKELLLAAHARNILNKPGEGSVRCVQNTLKISNRFPNLKYKIKAGRMYFHRKTVFDCIGLESLVLGNKKGFLPLNAILTDLGLDFSQVYLSNQQEVFAYISAPALLLLLESNESFLVLLNKRFSSSATSSYRIFCLRSSRKSGNSVG
ncbi:uncharacterized protein LOC111703551 [Eurytemora carolleeae]|uniref:uncharacterized protein LOC111703551 n=1 Tax=Eurytemora carolleeae TaxID=1294199 RepID=UPI000C7597CB|nr:uncharacterized protein LOC111703551 [Eurytemora carolleeae]XP_023331289.1 uncharacterized protein LOC111703551 [Eurytemora carolleeae]|eukprot:XP_023331288.1 uncharacterized protein LOC111703551 [Eurytemora affinis]